MSMVLTIAAAIFAAGIFVFIAFRVSMHVTDAKTNNELAARMPDGSQANQDSSSAIGADCGDGGGD